MGVMQYLGVFRKLKFAVPHCTDRLVPSIIVLAAVVLLLPVAAVRETAGSDVREVLDNVLNEDCTATILSRTVQIGANGSFVLPNIPSANLITRIRVYCEREDGRLLSGYSDFIQLVPGAELSVGYINIGPVPP